MSRIHPVPERLVEPGAAPASRMHRSLVDGLYAEALVLADESRAWFDRARGEGEIIDRLGVHSADRLPRNHDKDGLFHWAGRHDPSLRIALSCESLRLTTRIMHVIAWLLVQRAITAGELPEDAVFADHNRLGPSPEGCSKTRLNLPDAAQRLIDASLRLHDRVAQMEQALLNPASGTTLHPVQALHDRLLAAWAQ